MTSCKPVHVVLHVNSNGSILLWCPLTMKQKFLNKRANLDPKNTDPLNVPKMGGWFDICEDTEFMFKERPLCETRIRNGLLEIKAPLVFFQDSKFRNVVGYSPGFGKVGCFTRNDFNKDSMYMTWITYMEFFPCPLFQSIMEKFDVKWVVGEHSSTLIDKPEMLSLVSSAKLKGMENAKGLIVAVDKENNTCEIYCSDYGVCQSSLVNDSELKLGTYRIKKLWRECYFHASRACSRVTYVSGTVPIHVCSVACIAKGVILVATKPKIRLSIYTWEYIDSEDVLNVPGWNLKMKPEECTSDWWSMRYDSGKPLEVEYIDAEQRLKPCSHNILKVGSTNKEKSPEVKDNALSTKPAVVAERESITPVKSTSSPSKSLNDSLNNSSFCSTPGSAECSKSITSNTSLENDEIETDAVVVYIKEDVITLYAIKTKLSNPKFYTDRYRFQTDPKLGDWFHVNLRFRVGDRVFLTKAKVLSTPTLQTNVCENSLLKLFTTVNITDVAHMPQDDPDQICGHSQDLGPIIDNTKILKKTDVGKELSLWVLSTSYKNGAHWRIYSDSRGAKKKASRLR